jgi:hypothetical protein
VLGLLGLLGIGNFRLYYGPSLPLCKEVHK